jgi:predicted dehydrogenase
MTLRLGLVGRGRWGQNIERTLRSFPDVSLAIIARGDPAPRLDGVVIATPSATHAAVALPYIAAGVPTFIEKPMATAAEDAERLRHAAEKSGAIVFVGHIFLYHPAFVAALELVPKLGKLRYLTCEGVNDHPRRDSSVLWDWLPHHLSMAGAIFGRDPAEVCAWKLAGEATAETAVAKFSYGDALLLSTASWNSPATQKKMTAVGEDATLVFDDNAELKLVLHDKRGEIAHPPYGSELPLTRELRAFLDTLRSADANRHQLATAVAIVRAIAAAEESMDRGGQPVTLGAR